MVLLDLQQLELPEPTETQEDAASTVSSASLLLCSASTSSTTLCL
ncbi:SapB/AmfS family lanthipeptide [Streptomyces sp. NPDC002328]